MGEDGWMWCQMVAVEAECRQKRAMCQGQQWSEHGTTIIPLCTRNKQHSRLCKKRGAVSGVINTGADQIIWPLWRKSPGFYTDKLMGRKPPLRQHTRTQHGSKETQSNRHRWNKTGKKIRVLTVWFFFLSKADGNELNPTAGTQNCGNPVIQLIITDWGEWI